MRPLLSERRYLGAYAAAWLLLASLQTLLLVRAGLAAWPQAWLFSLPLCALYAFAVPSAHYLSRAMLAAPRPPATIAAAYGSAALLCGGLWLLLAEAWNGVAGGELVRLPETAKALLLAAGAALYLLSLLAHTALQALAQSREAQQRAAAARLQAREAELAALRLQLNPHFLFNSLNAISALTGCDPAAARDMTITLAQFYRHTLTLAGQQTVPLEQELALCTHYLAIERHRFGARLDYHADVSAAALTAPLPPLLLQPLLENAVKHGVQGGADGDIRLTAQTRDGWLYLRLDNPCAASPTPGTGTGLNNTRARLAACYGPRARLDTRQQPGRFGVEIRLPLET